MCHGLIKRNKHLKALNGNMSILEFEMQKKKVDNDTLPKWLRYALIAVGIFGFFGLC